MPGIVLFDGVCNLCSKSVQFIIEHDSKRYFQFASLQSKAGKRLIEQYKIPANIDSVVVIESGEYYIQSEAALKICSKLDAGWRLLTIFSIVPKRLRDYFYRIIASHRYRWFGKKTRCMLPSPELKSRFLE